MKQFEGKTAVISGGAEGIGLAVAKALGEEKMNIVLADIDEASLGAAAQELHDMGIPVLAVALDVAEEEQWQTVANETLKRFGKIHMLVNNAGVAGEAERIEEMNEKTWQWVMGVNLMGVVFGAKTMIPHIKAHQEGGWLLNVASIAGMGGVPLGGVYTATKTAVVGLSESWAAELAADGIGVSVLCPAFVKTRIHQSGRNRHENYKLDQDSSRTKTGRLDKVKEAVENGIDASIVGSRVVEAIKQGELYIFTHPNYRPVIQHRSENIDAAFERAAKSPLLKDVANQKLTRF
ncbi:MAG: SDR family NAD(P)-dependent oxidoreductase [Gammaproteobacteria bacterium]